MLQGLEQGHQQIGQHDHRQGEDHDAHIAGQPDRFLASALPQGVRQGGDEGGPDPRRRHCRAEQYGDRNQVAGGPIALLPVPAEPGGEDGHGGNTQGVGRCGEQVNGAVIGGAVEVRRNLGAEGPGLQGLPNDAQQLGKQGDQGHDADDMYGFVLFHFARSMISRISSSF